MPPSGKTRLHIFIDPSSAVGLIADVARDILPLIIFRCASLLELSRALFIRSDACRLAPLRRGFFREVVLAFDTETNGAARRWGGGFAADAFGLWTGGRPPFGGRTLAPPPGGVLFGDPPARCATNFAAPALKSVGLPYRMFLQARPGRQSRACHVN